MKRLLQDSWHLPRVFVIFIASMALVSVFGGYQLSRLIRKINDSSLQRAEQVLVIETNLNDAAIQLTTQVQEWKNMLLRVDDVELYRNHRKAFLDSSVDVQYALLRTKAAMQDVGLDTGVIDQLSIEHKSLVSKYLRAHANLNPLQIESSHAVDRQVIGVDRRLQQRLAEVKADTERLAQQYFKGTLPEQGNRYWLAGLLGGSSLMVMALIGFVFAFRFLDDESGRARRLSAP